MFKLISSKHEKVFIKYSKVTERSRHKIKVIRQKGEYQNDGYKKTEHARSSGKQTFITLWYAHVECVIRGKKCLFFGKLAVIYFLVTIVSRLVFLPYVITDENFALILLIVISKILYPLKVLYPWHIILLALLVSPIFKVITRPRKVCGFFRPSQNVISSFQKTLFLK